VGEQPATALGQREQYSLRVAESNEELLFILLQNICREQPSLFCWRSLEKAAENSDVL
jgi:hypothetical protein